MVAAWMSADAGVGPSMASGSQSWNGMRPDLPATPARSRTSAAVSTGLPVTRAAVPDPCWPAQCAMTVPMSVLPAPTARITRPTTNPMSATRVTRKAL